MIIIRNYLNILLVFPLLLCCSSGLDDEKFECHSGNNTVNFIFQYGVSLKNILNTYECTFQKDLVQDAPVTTNLKLTVQELDSVLSVIQSIDFFNYPDTFYVNADPAVEITPSIKYYYSVETAAVNKELYWNDSAVISNTRAENLRHLNNFIIELIESKDAYKNLPPPRGGYD